MKEKYGLDPFYVEHVLKLPPSSKVKIYDIDKIVNSRKKLSTSEKIEHLLDLKATLIKRLGILDKGLKLKGFHIEKYQDWKSRMAREQADGVYEISKNPKKEEEEQIEKRMSSSLAEPEPEQKDVKSEIKS
jgi:hypothetical protein